jgi:hypothetical protein
MQDVDTLIWAQSVIKSDIPKEGQLWPDYAVHATECALYYCVREYSAEVKNGTLVEISREVTDNKRNPASWQVGASLIEDGLLESEQKSLAFDKVKSIAQRTDLQLGSTFNLSQAAVDSISHFVQPTFGPCLNQTAGGTCDFETDPINGFYIAEGGLENGTVQYKPPAAKVLWDTPSIEDVFSNVARSMSNAIRNGADEGPAATVSGQIGVTTTVYRIDWRWITLHVIIEAGVVVFLAVTAWKSRTRYGRPLPVWKSSALAALATGENARGPDHSTATRTELEDWARKKPMSLMGGFHSRLVGGYTPVTSETEMNRVAMGTAYSPHAGV